MRWPSRILSALVVAVLGAQGSVADAQGMPVATRPVLDEFLGPAGSLPNPDLWAFDVGTNKKYHWEKGSLQDYTNAPDNVRLDGNGHLVIQARKGGSDSVPSYTSARMTTRGRMAFPYGVVSARIKFPTGQGIWSAFWMMGLNYDTVAWPECGEIDIMEIINTGTKYHAALHGPDGSKRGFELTAKGPIPDLSAGFHKYWVNRQPNTITIGIDDGALAKFTRDSLKGNSRWTLDQPMFALFNIAVGGDWPGPPDSSTSFPATMIIDWFSFEPMAKG
ncbi:MAG: glycoside hydrolase family 16 protein [Mycobacterium sp.]|nr:glycoside hydrolase family 16 protein [Mycobacterium sp.]